MHSERLDLGVSTDSAMSSSLTGTIIFKINLNALRQARIQAAETVARSRALRAEADSIVQQSREHLIRLRPRKIRESPEEAGQVVDHRPAPAIQLHAGKGNPIPELPSPRKIRSLFVQAQDESQRFVRVATELTRVVEDSAQTLISSAHFRQILNQFSEASAPLGY
jgi:hypothetical protein